MGKQLITKKAALFLILIFFISIFGLTFAISKNSKIEGYKILLPKNIKDAVKTEEYITLVTTGDIGLVRDINYKIQQKKDPNYPFLFIADYLRQADLTIINLEGPLINNCPIILEGFTFCGNSSNVLGLVYAGIDAANLANNHTTNYGIDGLNNTSKILKENGITPFGLNNKIAYLDLKGKKIALVGFIELGNNWEGLSIATEENIAKVVTEANKNAEIVITTFHWGTEYTYKPTENQIKLAHLAIDQGADIVLGNHPHYIQSTETYKDKIIVYAQGNTIFDQDWSQETREGVLYKFIYKNNKFEKIDEKFTIIENNSQPRFADDVETRNIISKIKKGTN